jgi:hypothetical protein
LKIEGGAIEIACIKRRLAVEKGPGTRRQR